MRPHRSGAAQCLKYDPAKHQFLNGWKLAKKGTGQAVVAVAISCPGTASTTLRTEQITITS